MSDYRLVAETPAPASAPIANDGFLPDIDVASFREVSRIRDAVTAPRAREALIGAMISAARDLTPWVIARRAEGAATLADVEAPTIDGESILVHAYRRAIFCYAKADLVERYRDVDTTQAGQRRAEDLDETPGELRRDALHAIRDMLGVGRTAVELI